MSTGVGAWVGRPPAVKIGNRMRLSDIPEKYHEKFVQFLGGRAQFTRSGEVVFDKELYERWITLQ